MLVIEGTARRRRFQLQCWHITAQGALGRSSIDVYVALSEFNRSLFCRAGFADASLFVKPNFLKSDPGPGVRKRTGALFVGRLIPEKGISTLLTAWKRIGSRLPLTIFGDGPLRDEVASAAKSSDGAVRWLGWRTRSEVDEALGAASVVISPSVWIEAGPLSVIESFARGTPVIASRLGSLAEFVKPDVSGYLFEPGNPASLVEAVETFLKLPDGGSRMGETARRIFLDTYSAEPAYTNMLALYDFARKNFEDLKDEAMKRPWLSSLSMAKAVPRTISRQTLQLQSNSGDQAGWRCLAAHGTPDGLGSGPIGAAYRLLRPCPNPRAAAGRRTMASCRD